MTHAILYSSLTETLTASPLDVIYSWRTSLWFSFIILQTSASWYTNPQTEALTQLLQIPNKVNPVPPGVTPSNVQNKTDRGKSMVREESQAMNVKGQEGGGVSSGRWSPSRVVEE